MIPVRLSPKAEVDLEDIGDYIARDNPERAASFVAELEQMYADLDSFSPWPGLPRPPGAPASAGVEIHWLADARLPVGRLKGGHGE